MREILFRGKSKNSNKWVFGWHCGKTLSPDFSETEESDQIIDFETLYWHTCEPNSIGQFTGLTDKNGKRIFEGDIVHVLGNQQVEDWKNVNYIGSIAFLDAGFCVIDGTVEDHAFRRYQLPRLDFDLEVIGNVYDNPRLLEVE